MCVLCVRIVAFEAAAPAVEYQFSRSANSLQPHNAIDTYSYVYIQYLIIHLTVFCVAREIRPHDAMHAHAVTHTGQRGNGQ